MFGSEVKIFADTGRDGAQHGKEMEHLYKVDSFQFYPDLRYSQRSTRENIRDEEFKRALNKLRQESKQKTSELHEISFQPSKMRLDAQNFCKKCHKRLSANVQELSKEKKQRSQLVKI